MARLLDSQECLPLDGEEVAFLLRRSRRRRTLGLRVSDTGQVVVNAPHYVALADIHRFLHKHGDWLRRQRSEARARTFAWEEGACLPWLGQSLTLVLVPRPGRPALRRVESQLVCAAPPNQVPAALVGWYQRQARPLLVERLAAHAARAGLTPPPLRLSNARTRWGSLSPKGVVSLNWRLIKASPEEIDYVICHELAHFRQRNHSPAFWREVEALFPTWKTVRRRLRENGRQYFQF